MFVYRCNTSNIWSGAHAILISSRNPTTPVIYYCITWCSVNLHNSENLEKIKLGVMKWLIFFHRSTFSSWKKCSLWLCNNHSSWSPKFDLSWTVHNCKLNTFTNLQTSHFHHYVLFYNPKINNFVVYLKFYLYFINS